MFNNWLIIYSYYITQIFVGMCGHDWKRLPSKRVVPSSNPPGVKIYFEAKPISNFKNLKETKNMETTTNHKFKIIKNLSVIAL